MSPSEKKAVSEKARRAAEIHSTGRIREAVDILGQLTDEFPFIRNAWAGRLSFLIEDGQVEEALRLLPVAIDSVLPNEDRSEFIAMAMELSFNDGKKKAAFKFALDFLEEIKTGETRLKASKGNVYFSGRRGGVVYLNNIEKKIS